MDNILTDPLFVLFSILAIGLAFGNVTVKGISLGSSGVLFAALLAGHYHLQVPAGVTSIGTALFVYCVGLGVGNRFFGSLRSQGSKLLLMSALVVGTAWSMTLLACKCFGLDFGIAAGLFAGACTSTPGLAAALESAETLGITSGPINIGYGVAYPFGVIGVVLFVQLLPRLLKKSSDSTEESGKINTDPRRIVSRIIQINNNALAGTPIMGCMENGVLQCRITRILKEDMLVPLSAEDAFENDMQVFAVGALNEVERDATLLGRIIPDAPKTHRLKDEMAEVLVLEPSLSNKTLREINTLSKEHPLAVKPELSLVELKDFPYVSFEHKEHDSFYINEEMLNSLHHSRHIRVRDRATLFDLLIGVNAYTVSHNNIHPDLTGARLSAIPLSNSSIAKIGIIYHRNRLLGKLSNFYIEQLYRFINEQC